MHSLLHSILPTGITIVLWCVCAATAVIVQPSQNNETPPLPDSPPTPFMVVVRTIPIIKQLPFEERWRDPAPQTMPFIISLADQYQQVSLQLKPDQQASQSAERPDPVCGSKGRRYFHIGHFCHGGAIDDQGTAASSTASSSPSMRTLVSALRWATSTIMA